MPICLMPMPVMHVPLGLIQVPHRCTPVITAADKGRAIGRPRQRMYRRSIAFRRSIALKDVERLRLESLIEIERTIGEASSEKTITRRPCNSIYRRWHLVRLQNCTTERVPYLYSLISPARDDAICSYR